MLRLVVLFLILGGSAVAARDGGFLGPIEPAPRRDGKVEKPNKWDTEKGRAIQFYSGKVSRGEMSLEQAMKEYRGKFYNGQMPDYSRSIEIIESWGKPPASPPMTLGPDIPPLGPEERR